MGGESCFGGRLCEFEIDCSADSSFSLEAECEHLFVPGIPVM